MALQAIVSVVRSPFPSHALGNERRANSAALRHERSDLRLRNWDIICYNFFLSCFPCLVLGFYPALDGLPIFIREVLPHSNLPSAIPDNLNLR